MVSRNGNFYVVVTEFQSELTTTQEFFVGPAFVVCIGRQTREPLCQQENIVAVFTFVFEVLITGAGRDGIFFNDIKGEVDVQISGFTRLQWLRQIDTHQGANNHIMQFIAVTIGDFLNVVTDFMVINPMLTTQCGQADFSRIATTGFLTTRATIAQATEVLGHGRHGVSAEFILIQLNPQEAQAIR